MNIFTKFQELSERYSTGRNIILLFIPWLIVGLTLLLYVIPEIRSCSNGLEIFDLRSNGYSAEEAKVLLESLGEEGRNVYLYKYVPLDMAFILIYLPLWSLILAFLFKKGFKPESRIHYFVVIPLFLALFDFLENTGVAIMLSIFPSFSSSLAGLAGILTVIKNYLATFFYVLVLIGIIGWIIKRVRVHKANNRISTSHKGG
uniref:Uncharacterized protein n=1 Tax=Candidatus Methanophagaceae archaeon ANME-1 ERB6 TaxID=2759912 RepID=A0A7G9YTT1_9EURY|nr:hypothetical protein PFCPEAIJ_00017 [Methanosarcinales archaeon ANME-1 ERB6]